QRVIRAWGRRALPAPPARPRPAAARAGGGGAYLPAPLLLPPPRAGEGAQSAVQRARSKEARLPCSLPRVRGRVGEGACRSLEPYRPRRPRPRRLGVQSPRPPRTFGDPPALPSPARWGNEEQRQRGS